MDQLEIVAPVKFREKLDVVEGDSVTVRVKGDRDK
jgi:CTP-dependent riboflavin kinase